MATPNYQRPQDTTAPTFQRGAAQVAPTFERGPAMQAPGSFSFDPRAIATDPGFQFEMGETLKGVNAGSAARGKLRSGDAAMALADRASGLAHRFTNDYFSRAMQKYGADVDAFRFAQNRQDQNFTQDRSFGEDRYRFNQGRDDNVFASDRSFGEDRYRYGQGRADTNFGADRSYGTELWANQQGRADQAFENDRTASTDAYRYAQGRADNVFDTDRGYQTGRFDQQTSNLFGIAGIGANAAAGTANAGNVFAQNATTNNNMRAQTTANAAIAGAQNGSNLLGQGLQAYGMYQSRQPYAPAPPPTPKTGTF